MPLNLILRQNVVFFNYRAFVNLLYAFQFVLKVRATTILSQYRNTFCLLVGLHLVFFSISY